MWVFELLYKIMKNSQIRSFRVYVLSTVIDTDADIDIDR